MITRDEVEGDNLFTECVIASYELLSELCWHFEVKQVWAQNQRVANKRLFRITYINNNKTSNSNKFNTL
jgi:hypothetical protein